MEPGPSETILSDRFANSLVVSDLQIHLNIIELCSERVWPMGRHSNPGFIDEDAREESDYF